MNQKQFGIVLVLLAVLGGAGFLVWKKQNATWSASGPGLGGKLLGDFPVNDVVRIAITESTNTLNLVKKDDLWRVTERGDYAANYAEVSGLLLKVRELKIVQRVEAGASQLGKLQLTAPGQGSNSAVLVEFKGQGDKLIKSLLLGKKHLRKSGRPSQFGEGEDGWPDGRYVKTGDATDVAVIADALDNVEAKPEQWLNKDFIHVEKPKSIEVAFPVATNSWKIFRETESGDWKLADAKPGEELDSSKVAGVSSPLSSPGIVDVLVSSKPEALGLDHATSMSISTFDGFTYAVKVGKKVDDNFPMTVTVSAQIVRERTPGKDEKPEEKSKLDKTFADQRQKLEDKLKQEQGYEKWTCLLAGWTVEPLLKERSQLLVEKKPEKGSATNSVEAATAPK